MVNDIEPTFIFYNVLNKWQFWICANLDQSPIHRCQMFGKLCLPRPTNGKLNLKEFLWHSGNGKFASV